MPILYSYFRSSSSFRVRIALALKAIPYEQRYINLKPDVSEQYYPDFLSLNPQGRVPVWVDDTVHLSQSAAILEYLEEAYPGKSLLPESHEKRAWVRQLVNIIACDIQPLNNISVLTFLKREYQLDQTAVNHWYAHWIEQGFDAIERWLVTASHEGPYVLGEEVTLADLYLIPQVWNAHRFQVPLSAYPRIERIYNDCMMQHAFMAASPEEQGDTVG